MPDNPTQTTSGFDFSDPGAGTNSESRNSAHIGCTMVYGYPTADERKGGNGTYTVAMCDYVVCVSHHKAWTDLAVSGKVLAPRLISATSDLVLCKLVEGEARPDQSPPILPDTLNEFERAKVQEVFNAYAAKLPSGRVMFDVNAYNAAAPSEPSF
jgi:hypothetical protein